MFSLPVSFVGFPGEPRRYGPRGHTTYKVTTHRTPGWSYHNGGLPHAFDMDPFASPMIGWTSTDGVPVTPRKRPDWTESVVCTGYSPDEVNLKVSADKVVVHCIHKEGDDENSDTRERKKTIHIPEDVESGDIKADMTKGGTLTLTAPYVKVEEITETTSEPTKDKKEKSESSESKKEESEKSSSKTSGTTQIKINRS